MPPPNAPSKEETARREREAWRLACRGWTQRDIADELGVTQGAVSQMLKRVETREAKRHSEEYDRKKVQNDGKLAHIYREALDAWHKSKEPLRRVRQTTDAEGNEVTVNELVEREGNPAYIDRALTALGDQRTLWGLNVNAADQEVVSNVAAMTAAMTARAAAYESCQNQAQTGNPESLPPGPGSGTGEVQDGPGPVQ